MRAEQKAGREREREKVKNDFQVKKILRNLQECAYLTGKWISTSNFRK